MAAGLARAIAYPGMGYDFVVNITTAIPITIVAPAATNTARKSVSVLSGIRRPRAAA
jgi:hypothetical protein